MKIAFNQKFVFMAPYGGFDCYDDGDRGCDKCNRSRNACKCTGEDEWCSNSDHYYECRKSECGCRQGPYLQNETLACNLSVLIYKLFILVYNHTFAK